MSKEAEYKKIFLQESEELLQQMNRYLLVLEKEPKDKEALNAIFRSAHTVKSMSASMGFRPIADLAHKMEDVLDQLRSEKLAVNEKMIDLLFRSFDSLEMMVGLVQDDRPVDTNVGSLVDALDSLLVKGVQFKQFRISEEITLNEFEKNTLGRVCKEGYASYHVKVTLEKNCVLKSVRAFMVFRNLHAIGEVIKSLPDSQSLEEEKFDDLFSCIFITREKKEAVEQKVMEVLDVEKAEAVPIAVDESWFKESSAGLVRSADETVSFQSEQIRKIQSVRVDIARMDKMMNLMEELTISKLRMVEVAARLKDTVLTGVVEQAGRIVDDLQLEVMQSRLVPVGQIFERFPRLVRDLVKKEGKKVKFEMIGSDIELDRTVLDEIGDPLIHLLRNAVDHAIETPAERKKKGKPEEGMVVLSARREKDHVFIEVQDDGSGMDVAVIKRTAVEKGLITEDAAAGLSDEDALLLTTNPGFSTKRIVTDVSGRGVGLDVVKKKTENLGGGIVLESKPGVGSKIGLRLPLTTAVVRALLARSLQRIFAVPVSSVLEIIVVEKKDIKEIEHFETVLHRKEVLPIVRLERLFAGIMRGDGRGTKDERLNVVIVEFGSKKFGVVVDKLVNQQNVVIKQLTKELKGIKGLAGATILGDGSVALVLDVATLV